MSFQMHLRSMSQPNDSGKPQYIFNEFDFDMCKGIEEGRTVWAVCTGLCFVLGFPAVIVIFWDKFKAHRRGTPLTPNDFFVLNLTVMDAVFLTLIPPGLLNHFILRSTLFEAFWNGTYCMNICGRPLLMACSCLDCYLAVVHPITYHKNRSLIPRVVMAAIVWAFTFAFGMIYFHSFSAYYTMITTVPFIVSIITIGVCDSFIFHTLVKSDSGRKNIHPQKKRAIQTLINSLVMIIFSYLPSVLIITIGRHLISTFKIFLCYAGIPMTITSSSGSTIMPILHLHNQGKLDRFRFGCLRNS